MAEEYSFSPRGEKFQLPGPKEYEEEFKRMKEMVGDQRALGREIVVEICVKIKK